MWTRAKGLAAQTPESRNRYVDFLRAVSIFAVIGGHWTAAAPHLDSEGHVAATHVLAVSPWTHWLTWVIQVMPVFFIVGGFSNGISWSAAMQRRTPYRIWLDGRLRRLVGPVLPLIGAWILIGASAHLYGVRERMIEVGSQMALIPTWFLAVYVMVVVMTPVTHALWRRFGMASFWGMVLIAAGVDAAYLSGWKWLGWSNYLFVWSAVHQLGYAWRDGRLGGAANTLIWAVCGFVALFGLVQIGPYPASMVGVPGEGISNTTPPKITLLALGVLQGGILLSLQTPLRRWLERLVPWTATVLVNGTIMTIYLWHLTAMVLVIGLLAALGGVGLGLEPGTSSWWSARPLWLGILVLALIPFVLVMSRFERPKARPGSAVAPSWRLVLGSTVLCLGIALLALDGVAGDGWLGLRWWVLALPFLGAAITRTWRKVPEPVESNLPAA
jgi:hypothetical protein